jgi:hypothetical protein
VNDDEIRARLRAFGEEPIDEQTRAAHMRRMSVAGPRDDPRRRGYAWAGIAAAAVVGFLAGSTGLAMADALPDPAQEVAHDVLNVVQVDVPEGKQGKRGPCVAEAAKIKDKEEKKAAKDACPKGGEGTDDDGQGGGPPATPGQGQGQGQAQGEGQGPPAVDDPCRGRPPWAGPMSKEQRAAAKASASRENCPKDDDEGDDADEGTGADAAVTTETTVDATLATTTTTTTTTTVPSSTTDPTESTESTEPSATEEATSGG